MAALPATHDPSLSYAYYLLQLGSRASGSFRYVSGSFLVAGFHTIAFDSPTTGHASRGPQLVADLRCSRLQEHAASARLAIFGSCMLMPCPATLLYQCIDS